MLTTTPSILADLHANIFALRSVLDKIDCITIPSHPASAIIHIYVRRASDSPASANGLLSQDNAVKKRPNPTVLVIQDAEADVDILAEERLLQDVVEETLSQGVLLTRAQRLRGHEALEPRPSIRIAASAALTRKETEKAAIVVKAALVKVLGRR